MPQNSDLEVLRLKKEGRYFNCKKKVHTMPNCPEKAKVSVILGTLDINDIKDIDQKKK